MKYDEFKRIIVNSSKEDWAYDDDLGIYINKNNISISIKSKRDDDIDNRFYEDWVKKFPDPKAYKSTFLLCYNGSTIEQFFTVAIDGYRILIPYPRLSDMTISYEQDRIAKIVNIPYTVIENYNDRYEEYKSRAGITIREEQV